MLSAIALAVASTSVRFLPYLGLLALGPMASGLSGFKAIWEGRIGAMLAVAGSALGLFYALLSQHPWPRLQYQQHCYPDSALQFARRQQLRGPMLNSFNHGGYLIFHEYPRLKVYVDGRNDIAYPLPFLSRALNVLDNPRLFAEETRRWRIEWLFVDNSPRSRSRVHLDRNPEWALVFASEPALIYVRRRGLNAATAERYAYQLLEPHDLEGSLRRAFSTRNIRTEQQALAEALRMVSEDRESYPANAALGLAYQLSGPELSRQMIQQWVKTDELLHRRK